MTIQEIARQAGVSAATVSRVFSRHPGIGEEVRNRVLEISRRCGYHPRFSNRQKNVVIITPANSAYPVQSCVDMLLMALSGTLPQRGFRLEILPVNNLERLDSIQFCGAVTIGCEERDFPDWPEKFPVPLVIVDRAPSARQYRENVCFVRSDEAQGMLLALEHLTQRGCRRIGCIIHGEPGHGNAAVRHEAIVNGLRKLGLEYDPLMVLYAGDGNEKYVELIGKLLKRGADALFCPGGNAGILALYALNLYNRKIPEEISFIASEQTFFSQFAVPPQSTISPDYPALAETVADELEKWLENRPLSPEQILPYQLICRESVR